MISYNSLAMVIPFTDRLVEIDLTGATLKAALTSALKYARGQSPGAFPYGWGLRFDVDFSSTEAPISNVEVNCRLEGQWTPLQDDTEYKIVASAYISGGKDGFIEFGTVPDNKKLNTGTTPMQAMTAYLTKGPLDGVPSDQRPVKSFTNAAGCKHESDINGCSGGSTIVV